MTENRNPWCSPWREVEGTIVLHVDLTPDAGREAEAVSLLDDFEMERWRGFLSVRARREFALCRAALRVSLSERLACTNRELSFDCLEHGKPVAKVAGQPVDTGFNVSHSGRHGLVAISGHNCLGVDVEERIPNRDLVGIGSLVCGPAERRRLGNVEGRDRVRLFYRLWSMKEALIKALGAGFSLSPTGFQVPAPMLRGAQSGAFRFPHLPSQAWRLLDLEEPRFAAALAYRLPSSPGMASPPSRE